MSFAPTTPGSITMVEGAFSSLWQKVTAVFGLNPRHQGLPPEQVLLRTPGIDPHFIPRAPMNNADLDVGLLSKLGNMGFKRGKEITAASHPEYYQAWAELCRRGGLGHVPQLILVESKIVNAGMIHGEEAGFVTTGLLKRLNFREAIAVQGHEVGHEVSDHFTPRALANLVLIGAGAKLGEVYASHGGLGSHVKEVATPSVVRRFAHWLLRGKGGMPVAGIMGFLHLAGGGWLGSVLASQLTVHPTELDADRKGAMISGDPEGLISALNKLESSQGHRGGWKTVRYYYHFITSGYPSTETRITKLRAIAQSMPPEVKPVYATIPPVSPEVLTQAQTIAVPPIIPAMQVSQVSAAARVEQAAATPALAI